MMGGRTNARSILSAAGREALEYYARNKDCLIAFDFDGTLAPIIDVAADVSMDAAVRSLLGELSSVRSVLIITGRSVEDIRQRIPQSITNIYGNHGLEGCPSVTLDVLEQSRLIALRWYHDLLKELSAEEGFFVENKTYSLSIHYRRARATKYAKSKAGRAALGLNPRPEIIGGKDVVNLVPPGLPNKYIALVAALEQSCSHHSIFVGDDLTDNAVFRESDERILGVKVGRSNILRAPWYLRSQGSIDVFLKALLFACSKH